MKHVSSEVLRAVIVVHSVFAAHALLTLPYPFSLYLPYLDPAPFLSHYLSRILLSTFVGNPVLVRVSERGFGLGMHKMPASFHGNVLIWQ